MTPFEAFELYTALKLHFTKPGYDFFKYNGKTKLRPESFDARTDKVFFQKLAKHQDVKGFLIANFLNNPRMWIRDLSYSKEAEVTYRDWLKKQQSLMYVFKSDLSHLDEDFDSNLVIREAGQHPGLLRLWLQRVITFETFCILVKMIGCGSYWRIKLRYDPMVETTLDTADKYYPFLTFDHDTAKKLVKDEFQVGEVA
jgi:hypothetical protein